MLSLEADIVVNALSAPLPATAPGVGHSVKMSHAPTDDEQISEASLLNTLNQQQVCALTLLVYLAIHVQF